MNDDGAVVGVENSEFNELSGSRWSDDHHEAIVEVLIANGLAKRVKDVFESDLIRLRTREGMKVAKSKGRLRGKQRS